MVPKTGPSARCCLLLPVLLFVGVGCRCDGAPSRRQPSSAVPVPAVAAEVIAKVRCQADGTFPRELPIAEASGAALLPAGARDAEVLLVVSDSGNDGAVLRVPLSGVADERKLEAGKLRLGDVRSDDVEGVAARGGALYTLTSSGVVRRFAFQDGALVATGAPYVIGPPPHSCPRLNDANCGKNWEGLCLRAESITARCAGSAASKTDGALHCVVEEGGHLRIDPLKPALALALPDKALSDCAFGAAGGAAERTLVVTTNVHGGSKSYVVDEASGELARIDVPGHVTNEAIAIDRGGALYQLMDDNHAPSAASRHVCTGW